MNRVSSISFIALLLCVAAARVAVAGEVTYLVTNLAETPGTPDAVAHAQDTRIHVVYGGGLPAPPATGIAPDVVDTAGSLYLYGEDSKILHSATGQEVCNPCAFDVSSIDRKATLSLDELILAAGGFAAGPRPGFAVVVLQGSDLERVGIVAQYVLSGSTPGGLSKCGTGHVTLLK